METDDPLVLHGPGTDSSEKTCALCGRFGVRGFMLRGWDDLDAAPVYGPIDQPWYVVCARESSCRTRREAQGDDEEEA